MARKPTFSPSKLSTYLACPVKYMWTYVDDRGRWYLRSKRQYSFGTSLHNVLQRFHDEGDSGVTTVSDAVASLEENWIEAGYSSQEEMLQALDEGREILARYIEQHEAEPVTAKTLYVEKTLRADLGPIVLMGRVDRLDEREDGTLEIVDYKSGRAAVRPEDVADDLAMGCYQVLVRRNLPGRPVVATIVALRAGSRATASLPEDRVGQFEADVVALADEIMARDWERTVPVGKPICPTCDFLPLCRRHPEFTEPEASSLPGTNPSAAP